MSAAPFAVVIPSAAGSPWLADAGASVRADGAAAVLVVGEGPEADVAVAVDAGFAERANAGLRAAAEQGFDRALLFNDDAALEPGALAALGEALDDGVAIAGAVLLEWPGGAVQQAGLAVCERRARVKARTDDPGPSVTDVSAVGGAAMALDLAAWRDLGGFEERFTFYFEDVDLCLRAGDRALRVAVVGAARARHRGGGTRSHRSGEAAYHLGRSHALLARRMRGGPGAAARRLAWVALLGATWTSRSVGPRGLGRFASGWMEGLRA